MGIAQGRWDRRGEGEGGEGGGKGRRREIDGVSANIEKLMACQLTCLR